MNERADTEGPVVVTGAAGFVGSYVTRQLFEEGYPLRALVRTESDAHAFRAIGIPAVSADIRDRDALRRAFDGASRVVHIAGLFRQANQPESSFFEINAEGTRNVFEAALSTGVTRIVHCSTVGVHGDVEHPPADEESPFRPGDAYQRSKLEGERIAREYFEGGRVSGVVIRPAMIYGPGDSRTLKLFAMIARGRFFYVGDGQTLVHFVDVRDLSRAFVAALERTDLNNEVFIIAGERAVPLRVLAEKIASTVQTKPPSLHVPVKPMQLLGSLCERICVPLGIEPPIFRRRVDFFTKNRSFDTAKAERVLGFTPAQCFDEEVRDITSWYLSRRLVGFAGSRPGERRSAPASLDPVELAHSPSYTMVRALDGQILYWSRGASSGYGYQRQEALGTVSHNLLRTEFDEPLTEINSRLQSSKRWRGRLVHTRRDGERVVVESEWLLRSDPLGAHEYVIEVNEAKPGDGSQKSLSAVSIGIGKLSMLCDLELLPLFALA